MRVFIYYYYCYYHIFVVVVVVIARCFDVCISAIYLRFPMSPFPRVYSFFYLDSQMWNKANGKWIMFMLRKKYKYILLVFFLTLPLPIGMGLQHVFTIVDMDKTKNLHISNGQF